MGEKVIVNIKTFADGHTPPDRVVETMFGLTRQRRPSRGREWPGYHHTAQRDRGAL